MNTCDQGDAAQPVTTIYSGHLADGTYKMPLFMNHLLSSNVKMCYQVRLGIYEIEGHLIT